MKPVSSLIIYIVIAAISLVSGCKKDNATSGSNTSNASITGQDMRAIVCGGTYFVQLQTAPNTYGGTIYNVTNTGQQLGLTAADTFPLHIHMNWTDNGVSCGYDKITITSFQRQ